MALLRRHRLPVPLLLAFFLFAASRGAPPGGGDRYDPSICQLQPRRCGDTNIRYPFYLYNETAVLLATDGYYYCGYPGLAIQCNDDKQAVLLLNGSSYTVSDINYQDYTVTVADQEAIEDQSCPRIDHNVTIPPGSWLSDPNTAGDYLLFFLNCSRNLLSFSPISCGSFRRLAAQWSFVLPGNEAPTTGELFGELIQACQPVIKVPILQLPDDVQWNDSRWINGGYGAALRSGFKMEWDQKKPPPCVQCEQSDGRCGYNQTGGFMGCLCSGGRVEANNCTTDSSGNSLLGTLNSSAALLHQFSIASLH